MVFNTESPEILNYIKYERTGIELLEESAVGVPFSIDTIIRNFQCVSPTFLKTNLYTPQVWKNVFLTKNKVLRTSVLPYIDNLYSSYAFANTAKEERAIRLPLTLSLSDTNRLFKPEDKIFNYAVVIEKLLSTFELSIKEDTGLSKSTTVEVKKSLFASNQKHIKVGFSENTIQIDNSKFGFSEAEKIVKIVDAVVGKNIKDVFVEMNPDDQQSKYIMFAASLYADLQILSVLEYGTEEDKLKIYNALVLQLCNALAALNSDEDVVKVVKGANAITEKICAKLGINVSDMKNKLINLSKLRVPENVYLEIKNNAKEKYTRTKVFSFTSTKKAVKNKITKIICDCLYKKINAYDKSLAKFITGKKMAKLKRELNYYDHMNSKFNAYADLSSEKMAEKVVEREVEEDFVKGKIAALLLISERDTLVDLVMNMEKDEGNVDNISSRLKKIAEQNGEKTITAYVKKLVEQKLEILEQDESVLMSTVEELGK